MLGLRKPKNLLNNFYKSTGVCLPIINITKNRAFKKCGVDVNLYSSCTTVDTIHLLEYLKQEYNI